jgi:hypothetical protein
MRAFEEVLHSLAGAVRGQPGHLNVTVLRPAPAGRPSTPSCRTSEPEGGRSPRWMIGNNIPDIPDGLVHLIHGVADLAARGVIAH